MSKHLGVFKAITAPGNVGEVTFTHSKCREVPILTPATFTGVNLKPGSEDGKEKEVYEYRWYCLNRSVAL